MMTETPRSRRAVLSADKIAKFERRMARMGCKGGTSANAGRKATTYSFKYPDGRSGTKRSYQVNSAEAVAMVYQHQGVWYVSGIRSEPQKWPGQQPVPAYRRGGE